MAVDNKDGGKVKPTESPTVTDRDSNPTAPDAPSQDVAEDTNKGSRSPRQTRASGPGGLRIENSRKEATDTELDNDREVPVWEKDDAPDGSTEGSLLVYENGVPVRVSGPTHYTHLANGQIVGGYGIGTHHTDDDGNVVPILNHYAG
jgi:hypothetical protein